MAVDNNLTDFIQSIVNAVGEKTGDAQINAQELPEKIRGISTPTSLPFKYFLMDPENTSGKLYVPKPDGSSESIYYSGFALHLPYKYNTHDNMLVEGEFLFCYTNSTGYKKMTPTDYVYYSTNNSDSIIKFSITDSTNGDVSLDAYYPIDKDEIYATYGGETSSIQVSNVDLRSLKIEHDSPDAPTNTTIGGSITIFFNFKTDQ